MMGILDDLSIFKKEEKEEDFIKSEIATPFDIFLLVTQYKIFSEVLKTKIYYVVYQKTNKKYDEIVKVSTNLDSIKGMTTLLINYIVEKKVKEAMFFPAFKMFSSIPELLTHVYHINNNYNIDYVNLEDMLKYLEKVVPKKKYFVKGSKIKKEDNTHLDNLCRVFRISKEKSEMYYEILLNMETEEREKFLQSIDPGGKQ